MSRFCDNCGIEESTPTNPQYNIKRELLVENTDDNPRIYIVGIMCRKCWKNYFIELDKISAKYKLTSRLINVVKPETTEAISKIKKEVKKKINPLLGKIIENDITKKVKEIYSTAQFFNNPLKDVSTMLNNSYNSVMSKKTILNDIRTILKKYGRDGRTTAYTYLKYFVLEGTLEERKFGRFELVKNNLIPKPKKEQKDRGIFDELGW